MHRRLRLLALLGAVAVPLGGCVDTGAGIAMSGVVPPNAECFYTLQDDAIQLSGLLDLNASDGYFMAARIENQMLNVGASGVMGVPRADVSSVVIDEAQVRFLDPLFEPVISRFRVPASGFIPSGEDEPGEGIASAIVIPTAVFGELRDELIIDRNFTTVILDLRFSGRTLGRERVTAPEYFFRVELCEGCLQITPPPRDPDTMDPICVIPCQFGQDEPFTTFTASECASGS